MAGPPADRLGSALEIEGGHALLDEPAAQDELRAAAAEIALFELPIGSEGFVDLPDPILEFGLGDQPEIAIQQGRAEVFTQRIDESVRFRGRVPIHRQ